MSKKITIIGSGLGGLLTGFLLSKEGLHVTILEKHGKVGGCLQSFTRDKYTFDTGMHYIGSMHPGQTLHRYWQYFGLPDKLDLMPMDQDGFDIISFPDAAFPLAQGFDHFIERLLPHFPEATAALRQYTGKLHEVADAHPLYNLSLPKGYSDNRFQYDLACSFLSELTLLSHQVYPVKEGRHQTSGVTLAEILAGNNFLYAGHPDVTSLSQFGLINHSFISSAWRLAGGSKQIAEILTEGIRSNGGEVLCRKQVTEISKPSDIFSIETSDGDHVESSMIISGIHPAATLQLIKGINVQAAYRKRLNSLKNTISVFSVYLGLKPDTFPFLNHNVYHHTTSSDLKLQWPSHVLFMTPPEKGQGAFARTAVVMAPMSFDEVRPWERTASGTRVKSYFVFKAMKAKQLLDNIYQKFPALKEAIATIETSTPLTWRDYTGTPEGSMYGIQKDGSNPARTSVFPKTKIPGLFLTGQNVNMHGAVGVTIGAVMTCGEILGLPYVLKAIKRAG